jgi:hypothetical protein
MDINDKWEACLKVLDIERPEVQAARRWLLKQREEFPDAPPTLVAPNAGGDTYIEWHWTSTEGVKHIVEATFSTDGTREWVEYRDGRITEYAEATWHHS